MTEFKSLDEALVWLSQLPALLDVEIIRTNRTGEKSDPARRNIHGQKTFRVGDWMIRISEPIPVPGEPYHTGARNVAYGDGDTLLEALQMVREQYDNAE